MKEFSYLDTRQGSAPIDGDINKHDNGVESLTSALRIYNLP